MSIRSERRFRELRLTDESLMYLLKIPGDEKQRYRVTNLPDDAEIVCIRHDPYERLSTICVASKEFLPVPPNHDIPWMDLLISSTTVKV